MKSSQCGGVEHKSSIWLVFTRDSCTGRYCWECVLAMGILSVCLSVWGVTTRYRIKPRSDRDSGFSPYDSLESLVSNEIIWCRWVMRFPSNEGIKEEIVILPLLARLASERLQIDRQILLIITSTADELSGGTNINDLERPWTPKIWVLSEFFCYFRLWRTLRVNFRWNILEIDQENLRTKLNWCCHAFHEH